MSNRPTDDQMSSLRSLANRWALNARDYSREAKSPKVDAEKAAYNRGLSDAFYKAALDLAALLKNDNLPVSTGSISSTSRGQVSATQRASGITYAPVTVGEVIQFLEFVGISPRDVTVMKDNSVYAVFSRWQPINDVERVSKIKSADTRVVIIGNGKVRDTNDPYVEFAFKPQS
jgi:hypothetical protein